jgi:hypothetical protein
MQAVPKPLVPIALALLLLLAGPASRADVLAPGELLVAEGSAGLLRVDPATGAATPFASAEGFAPWKVGLDAWGRIFALTDNHLVQVASDGSTITPIVEGINADGMMRDADGAWLLYGVIVDGLARVDPLTHAVETLFGPDRWDRALANDGARLLTVSRTPERFSIQEILTATRESRSVHYYRADFICGCTQLPGPGGFVAVSPSRELLMVEGSYVERFSLRTRKWQPSFGGGANFLYVSGGTVTPAGEILVSGQLQSWDGAAPTPLPPAPFSAIVGLDLETYGMRLVTSEAGGAGSPAVVPGLPRDVSLEPRPEFRWAPVPGATSYQLEVSRGGRRFLSTTVSGATSFAPGRALPPGSYEWRTRPRKAGKAGAWAPPVRFDRLIDISAPAGPPDPSSARCIDTLVEGLVDGVRAYGENAVRCAGPQARANVSTLRCLADPTQRTRAALRRTERRERTLCRAPEPTFAALGSPVVDRAAHRAAQTLVEDLLEAEVLEPRSSDPAEARCRAASIAAAERCLLARVEQFAKCTGDSLAAGTFATPADSEACRDAEPAAGTLAACGAAELAAECALPGDAIAAAAPGCDAQTPAGLAACIDAQSACHACRAASESAGLTSACASCPEP